jgi:hypothetical protein
MLVLMAIRNMDYGIDSLKRYQKDKWGSTDSKFGETCVIELSGLPSPSLYLSHETGSSLEARIHKIRDKILNSKHKPKLVVMYGLSHRSSWEKIADGSFADPPNNHFTDGSTVFALVPHPSRPKWGNRVFGNKDWIKLGEDLRKTYQSLCD